MANLFKRILGEKQPVAAPTDGAVEESIEPIHVSDGDFDQVVLQAGKPAVVDFWADWCTPCHMIAPSVQDLAETYDGRAVVAKLNVDENPGVADRYGIRGIPTLLFFKGGKVVDQQVGVVGYAQLASKLEKLLA